ncbi:integrase family protein [Segniliparus rotundus DSM 44985]|uniref:Integrase family protein n=1 Tax=Segniliparus rotundus (strain ATCC BAA-972 / CDC 1076 / CIP 108378 / DSM 44985 / JCM 13578) TaxID=640132 RepID=D6Z7E5_SEGRD|nr:integrase family protein [Segniliparus rotundus DSM 44985]
MARQQLPPQIKKVELSQREGGKPAIRYQVTVDVGTDPITGKRRQARKRFATEQQARAFLANTQAEVSQGLYVHQNELTVKHACADWLSSRHNIKPKTRSGYEQALMPVISQLGHLEVQKLAKRHIDTLVSALREGKVKRGEEGGAKFHKPWSARSVNYMLLTIGMVLEDLKEQGVLSRNVASLVTRIKQQRTVFTTFTAAETQQVLASIEQDRLRHAWHLALSGLRRAEIAGLRWDDVDLRAKTLTIKHTIVSVGGKAVEQDDGKTEKSGRTLPLTAPLLAELKAAKARQSTEKLAFGPAYQGGDHVVCDEAGRLYHPDTLTSKWAQAVKAVPDVPKIRLHDARHTCGTLMHLQGVPIAVISAWLGHADASFTMRTYVHSQPNALRDAALTLGRVVTICDKNQLDAQGQRITGYASAQFRTENLAPPAGLEPATVRLTVGCSAN